MSTRAKLTLASTTIGAIGIVIFVHYQQKADQAVRPTRLSSDLMQEVLTDRSSCIKVSSEIWNSNGSNENASSTSKCNVS